jgi:hypothetical protein
MLCECIPEMSWYVTDIVYQCANAVSNAPVLQPLSSCSMPCTGNKSEICGAAGHLSLYAFNGTILNTTTPIQTLTSTSATTPTATPLVPSPLVIGSYSYQEVSEDSLQAYKSFEAEPYITVPH